MNPVLKDPSCWREVDQLDGKDLIKGDKLLVKWLDGTITEEVVETEEFVNTYNDQGSRTEIGVRKAYINCFVRGGFIPFYLAENPKTLCERVKK